jgi:hypothetical protein
VTTSFTKQQNIFLKLGIPTSKKCSACANVCLLCQYNYIKKYCYCYYHYYIFEPPIQNKFGQPHSIRVSFWALESLFKISAVIVWFVMFLSSHVSLLHCMSVFYLFLLPKFTMKIRNTGKELETV